MTLEARACAYGKVEVGGLLSLAESPRHGIARCQKLNDHFIFDSRADVAINALNVLGTIEVVGCGQGDPLVLHRMEFSKFLFVQMAGRAERVVLF
jgi:hypothetical protein